MDIESYTVPADSEILKLDMKLLGLPSEVSDLRVRVDKNFYNSISGVDTQNLLVQKPIFTKDDDEAIRRQLGIIPTGDNFYTFQEHYNKYKELQRRYVVNVFLHGSFILRKDVSCFIQEVEAFNKELWKLRLKVLNVLKVRGYARHIALKFNPRVNYGIYILTVKQCANEFFCRMKDKAINNFLKQKDRQ